MNVVSLVDAWTDKLGIANYLATVPVADRSLLVLSLPFITVVVALRDQIYRDGR